MDPMDQMASGGPVPKGFQAEDADNMEEVSTRSQLAPEPDELNS